MMLSRLSFYTASSGSDPTPLTADYLRMYIYSSLSSVSMSSRALLSLSLYYCGLVAFNLTLSHAHTLLRFLSLSHSLSLSLSPSLSPIVLSLALFLLLPVGLLSARLLLRSLSRASELRALSAARPRDVYDV